MRISIEKAADGSFIVIVPAKEKKNPKGDFICQEDLKYTAKTEDEALKIIGEALKEIKSQEDEYGIAFKEASKKSAKK
jgi:predicted RNase H-like HicB family nuclease